jgi:hypothetical protein
VPLGNPLLIGNRVEKVPVPVNILLSENHQTNIQIARIKVADLKNANGDTDTLDSIRQKLGFDISQQNYTFLRTSLNESRLAIKNCKIPVPTYRNELDAFATSFKRGSRPFRRTLEFERNYKLKSSQKQTVKSFFRLVDVHMLEESDLAKINSQWNIKSYPNKLREFILKFRNNLLGINTRVSHFNNNVSRACAFCTKNNIINPPDETFSHLFFYCPSTNLVLNQFYISYIDGGPNPEEIKIKKLFFFGINPLTNKIDNFFISTVAITAMHFIWECKLQKKIPVIGNMLNDIYFNFGNISSYSSRIRDDMNLNLALCRNWNEEVRRNYS